MRYTRLRVWVIFFAVVAGVIFVLNYSTGGPGIFKSQNPVTDSLLIASYPDLYATISKRDAAGLKPFLTHQHDEVRAQAWRAFAQTPTDSIGQFIDLAKDQNTEEAWFGISKSGLSQEHLRSLEQSWVSNPQMRSGIALVLGQQGDEKSLHFLLAQMDDSDISTNYHFALAIGRLVQKFEVSSGEQVRIIQNAFGTEKYETTQAYLYGWYRGDESKLSNVAQDTLFGRWQLMGTGINRDVDQYINKIIPARTTHNMVIYYNGEQMLDDEVQLSYELAKSIGKIELNDKNSLAAKILLTNANPHVQLRALQSLEGKLQESGLSGYVTRTMISDARLDDEVWLQAVQAALVGNIEIESDYHKRLAQIPEENRYLWPQVLAIYQQTDTTDDFLNRVQEIVDQGNPLSVMFALQSLNGFWEELPTDERTDKHIEQIRGTVFRALELKDRGVTYTSQPLLQRESLFGTNDFDRINKTLSAFSLPEDIEVYQVFGMLYKNNFEQQATAVIDSLASLKYLPLNRSLADAGWDVEVPQNSQTDYRLPDWDRLWELGRQPVLTLVTDKGQIQMQLNTLSEPATVSAIDSLSRAGAYDGIPFHRVVPNFVIQGGDIERKDGFGGPDFVIPTEANHLEFVRGAVGIASAGADTEGSQYFIMHQWMPHLNGNYTRFGKVIDGMEVVDEIQQGDKVLSTTWY